MKIFAKPKTIGVTSLGVKPLNRPSIVLNCVGGIQAKQNYNATMAGRTYSFWTVPAGNKGDRVIVGDEFWFYSGKDTSNPAANLIIDTRVVVGFVEVGTPEHAAICESWVLNDAIESADGEYKNRRIVVLAVQPCTIEATFQDLLDMFCKKGSRQLPSGCFRASVT